MLFLQLMNICLFDENESLSDNGVIIKESPIPTRERNIRRRKRRQSTLSTEHGKTQKGSINPGCLGRLRHAEHKYSSTEEEDENTNGRRTVTRNSDSESEYEQSWDLCQLSSDNMGERIDDEESLATTSNSKQASSKDEELRPEEEDLRIPRDNKRGTKMQFARFKRLCQDEEYYTIFTQECLVETEINLLIDAWELITQEHTLQLPHTEAITTLSTTAATAQTHVDAAGSATSKITASSDSEDDLFAATNFQSNTGKISQSISKRVKCQRNPLNNNSKAKQ